MVYNISEGSDYSSMNTFESKVPDILDLKNSRQQVVIGQELHGPRDGSFPYGDLYQVAWG